MNANGILAAALSLVAASALAGVTRVEITKREPFADGRTFGAAGAYERVSGRFHGELDPSHPLNRGIVDLQLAPRNARGRVEYSADLDILRPADLARGNGSLFYDVNNRGNKLILWMFNNTLVNNALDKPEHAGDGFLFRHGFTVVWSGWIHDLPATPHLQRLSVPRATAERIEQPVWDEFLYNVKTQLSARLSFRAVSTDKSRATLTVRGRNDDTPSVIQPGAWEFVDDQTIRLLPAGTPFAIGQMYQLNYRAEEPPVSGISFAATRDLIAFLRYQAADNVGNANPLASAGRPAMRAAIAHGTSQSGRYLRDFVYQGFNESEDGRIVFDGMNPHIASARIYLNHRFAQPNRLYAGGYGFFGFPETTFPQAYTTQPDPYSGRSDGLLKRCGERGNCPKIIHTVTSTEYWQGGQSLGTTDPLGRRDAVLPENVRVYHIAGTQHVHVPTMPKGVCVVDANLEIDPRPVLRSLALALDRWVKDGAPPPASRYPRIDAGTLVPAGALQFPDVAGLTAPREPNPMHRFDYGPRYAQGIIDHAPPKILPGRYAVLVPKVDADGNEIAGVRVPELAAPRFTATGWSLRSADGGAAGELCHLDGVAIAFAKTAEDRARAKDPRPALAERYASHEDYIARIRAAAADLVKDGYLLGEDAERAVAKARAFAW